MKRLLIVALLALSLVGCGSHATVKEQPLPVKAQNFAWGEYTVCCEGCYATVSHEMADVCWGGSIPCPQTCPGTCR